MTFKNRKQQGFTLVELLIVVIILGILAAVVIPQFNTAAGESKEAALASNLATVRQAIEMYKVQHDDAFPSGANNLEALTSATDIDGTINAAGLYGPYLRNSFPKNPIDATAAVSAVDPMPGAPDGNGGWIYDTGTGEFRANVANAGPSGIDYFDL